MIGRYLIRPAFWFGAWLVVGQATVQAQADRDRFFTPQPNPLYRKRTCTGLVLGTGQSMILARDSDDDYQPYVIIHPKGTRVSVSGRAKPSLLSTGQTIRFTAPIESGKERSIQVDRLDLVSLRNGVAAGVWPAPRVRGQPRFTIVARVTTVTHSSSRNQYSVSFQVPKNALGFRRGRLWIPENAPVMIDGYDDHRLARPGDRIEVEGCIAGVPFVVRGIPFVRFDNGQIVALNVKIELANLAGRAVRKNLPAFVPRMRATNINESVQNIAAATLVRWRQAEGR